VRVELDGIEIELLAERAAACGRTVFVADLHFGKSEAYRAVGAAVPGGDVDEQLARLASITSRVGAHRVVVLGDLLHVTSGVTESLVERVATWRAEQPWSMTLVRGNHDVAAEALSARWQFELIESGTVQEGIELVHDPDQASGRGVWMAGHIHPAVWIGRKAGGMRVPCFCVRQGVGLVLPAFSVFTSGVRMRPDGRQRVFAIAGGRVLEVGRPGANGTEGSLSLGHVATS